ncbi:unnamed protein product [Urochloa humidicola]
MANGREFFCPEQTGLEGPRPIPIIEYQYHGGPRAYRKLMRRRWRRARKIASVLIGRYMVPVTPLPNPVTKKSSCHIIRLLDKLKPNYCVDLLFLDSNSYLVAFRRQRRGKDGLWSNGNKWFVYSDMEDQLPPELKAKGSDITFLKRDLPPLHTKAPKWFEGIKVKRPGSSDPVALGTLDEIIGERGELMLVLAQEEFLATAAELKQRKDHLRKNTTQPVPEPGFARV